MRHRRHRLRTPGGLACAAVLLVTPLTSAASAPAGARPAPSDIRRAPAAASPEPAAEGARTGRPATARGSHATTGAAGDRAARKLAEVRRLMSTTRAAAGPAAAADRTPPAGKTTGRVAERDGNSPDPGGTSSGAREDAGGEGRPSAPRSSGHRAEGSSREGRTAAPDRPKRHRPSGGRHRTPDGGRSSEADSAPSSEADSDLSSEADSDLSSEADKRSRKPGRNPHGTPRSGAAAGERSPAGRSADGATASPTPSGHRPGERRDRDPGGARAEMDGGVFDDAPGGPADGGADTHDGRDEARAATARTGQVSPVLPLGAGLTSIGLGLGLLALRLRRG